MEKKKINSLYIHIPFCRNICPYCDFTKIIKNQSFEDKYIDKLLNDINCVKRKFDKFKTIYIGGGTPSCLSFFNLERILVFLQDLKYSNAEFTIEANPEDINDSFLKLITRYGVNRISIGVQSFNEATLSELNRKKTDFTKIISITKKYIQNINLDFIYGLPGEDEVTIENNLDNFLKLDVNHISIYSLTINPGTIFYNKKIKEIDEDLNRKYYDLICKKLIENNFIHYEISNFSKPGYESKHNFNYWHDNEFLGIGLGAFGYINDKRYSFTKNLDKYISDTNNIDFIEKLSKSEQEEEYIMLNLRTNKGINFKEFNKRFSIDFNKKYDREIKKLKDENLIIINKESIVANHNGMAILDKIILSFFAKI